MYFDVSIENEKLNKKLNIIILVGVVVAFVLLTIFKISSSSPIIWVVLVFVVAIQIYVILMKRHSMSVAGYEITFKPMFKRAMTRNLTDITKIVQMKSGNLDFYSDETLLMSVTPESTNFKKLFKFIKKENLNLVKESSLNQTTTK